MIVGPKQGSKDLEVKPAEISLYKDTMTVNFHGVKEKKDAPSVAAKMVFDKTGITGLYISTAVKSVNTVLDGQPKTFDIPDKYKAWEGVENAPQKVKHLCEVIAEFTQFKNKGKTYPDFIEQLAGKVRTLGDSMPKVKNKDGKDVADIYAKVTEGTIALSQKGCPYFTTDPEATGNKGYQVSVNDHNKNSFSVVIDAEGKNPVFANYTDFNKKDESTGRYDNKFSTNLKWLVADVQNNHGELKILEPVSEYLNEIGYVPPVTVRDNDQAEQQAAPEVDSDGFLNIPDGIDEELPFN